MGITYGVNKKEPKEKARYYLSVVGLTNQGINAIARKGSISHGSLIKLIYIKSA